MLNVLAKLSLQTLISMAKNYSVTNVANDAKSLAAGLAKKIGNDPVMIGSAVLDIYNEVDDISTFFGSLDDDGKALLSKFLPKGVSLETAENVLGDRDDTDGDEVSDILKGVTEAKVRHDRVERLAAAFGADPSEVVGIVLDIQQLEPEDIAIYYAVEARDD